MPGAREVGKALEEGPAFQLPLERNVGSMTTVHMNENSLFALKGALGNVVATVTQGSWGEDPRARGQASECLHALRLALSPTGCGLPPSVTGMWILKPAPC